MFSRDISRFQIFPNKYQRVILPFFLSMLMTFIISLISSLWGVGPRPGFLGIWLPAWILSWVIAFPTLLLILPFVQRVTAMLVKPSVSGN